MGAVNNPKPTGCKVKETVSVLKFFASSRLTAAHKKGCTDRIAFEIEARG